ncbi:sugar ABC transporter substrate-binding protein [Caldalkalibacillus salinus]|uniref:sugar ABC transporter substrate-binding protein n=1 Tax=Caldalkalibacillus salinus TaxID=2803787 RepID=UPI001923F2A4|nr:maltose ABC transporter substrate-binding protein [Caldalkalibacillus salinus]
MFKQSRILTLLLLFMLSVTLVACGSDESNADSSPSDGQAEDGLSEDFEVVPEEGAELTLWSDGDESLDWAKEMAEAFEAEYGIPVTVEEVGQEDAPERLATDGPSGLAADVFPSTHDRIGRAISAGLVIENFWPEEYEEAFVDAAIEATTFDGMLYGYPNRIETYALFYNNDLVEQAPETMDDLFEIASNINDESDKYGFMMEPGNFYFNYAFFGGYGGYVFGDGNTDVSDIGLNNEGAVEAVELIERMRHELLPAFALEDITYDVKTALFENGDLALDINGPWAVEGYKSAGVDFSVAPLPVLDNGDNPTSFSGTSGFYVNAYTEYPNAASLLAQFITNEENLLRQFEVAGHLPPREVLIDDEAIQSNPYAVAFLEQVGHAVPMPNIPEMPLVWDPMEAAVANVWNDGSDPQEALDKAVNTIEQAIQEQQK